MSSSQQEGIDFKLPSKIHIGPKEALAILVAIGSLGVTIFWTYSDSRNANLFVSSAVYKKDTEQFKETYNKDMASLVKVMDEIKAAQVVMQKDVKDILKEQKK